MRAGQLSTPADILRLNADLSVSVLDWVWVGIRAKESTDSPAHTGLRAPAKVTVRAWWDERLQAGRYLRAEGRLLLLDDVRDFNGQRAEVAITCSELVGECCEYRPAERPPRPCRVFLNHSAPYLDDIGQVVDYRLMAEVALVETGRPQVDDQLLVSGVLYNVIGIANRGDDGVVRGLWLEEVG